MNNCKGKLLLTTALLNLFVLVENQATYDKNALHELTQFRQQYRKANGELCAGAFIQNMKAYTDCTDDPDPDGGTGREWCYLESQISKASSQKRWGYCSPVIDYNFIRAKANEALQAKANEVEKMTERLDQERSRLEEMITKYNRTCTRDSQAIEGQLLKVETLISKGDHCLSKIKETTSKIKVLKEAVSEIDEKLKKQLAESLKAPENCAAIPGYEDEVFPDGIKGAYFNNPLFKGQPTYRTDENINFRWNSKDPIPGVSNIAFSVRWEGYIQSPFTKEYIFALEADCGGRLFINNIPIIIDRMPPVTQSELSSSSLPEEIPLLPPTEHDGVRQIRSEPVLLTAGEKNRIRVEMIHSNHLRWKNPDDASIRLKWLSLGSTEEIIRKEYFYQSNSKPPLKISGIDINNFDISYLYDGEYAYKGSTKHFLADVPMRYYRATVIRPNVQFQMDTLSFLVNAPAHLYVAYPMGHPSPVAPCTKSLHPTEDILSVYEAESRDSVATKAQYMAISKMDIKVAEANIKMNVINSGVPFLIFLVQAKEENNLCAGRAMIVSHPTSTSFSSCEVSSKKSVEFDCMYGLNGRNSDQAYGCWKTAGGNGVGEYMTIRFKTPVRLTELRFKPLDDPVNWPAEIVVRFSETSMDSDETQIFTILHSGNSDNLKYPINSIVTSYVRIEFTKMYVTGEDTGGSFELYGTECKKDFSTAQFSEISRADESEETASFVRKEEILPTYIENCGRTIYDNFASYNVGTALYFVCPSYCFNSIKKQSNTSVKQITFNSSIRFHHITRAYAEKKKKKHKRYCFF